MTTTPHIKQVHDEMYYTSKQVMEILNWSSEQYSWFQYEQGLEYLKHYLSGDEAGQKLLEKEKLFWNWWKNLWHHRDIEFVQDVLKDEHPVSSLQLYILYNDGCELSDEIQPSKIIIGNAFATEKQAI